MCVCPLIPAASHIGITKERYQWILRNTGIVLNFANFPKNDSFIIIVIITLSIIILFRLLLLLLLLLLFITIYRALNLGQQITRGYETQSLKTASSLSVQHPHGGRRQIGI